jgi:hypothetical protein
VNIYIYIYIYIDVPIYRLKAFIYIESHLEIYENILCSCEHI